MPSYSKVILFYNKKSGQSQEPHHRRIIQEHFSAKKIDLKIIDIPKPSDEIVDIVTQAISEGADLIIAAGGDGTVSLVANALIDTGIPMGIIPLGTGNLLAKELKVPLEFEEALEFITSSDKHKIIKMDTFRLEGRHFLLNLSVGVTPEVMKQTDSEDKQQMGSFAYLINFIHQILGLKLKQFSVEHDQQKTIQRASEILISNCRSTGVEALKWPGEVSINDGILDLFIFRANNLSDLFGLVISIFTKSEKMNPAIKIIRFKEYCKIETQTPMRLQADGDAIGETPVEIRVHPNSLTIMASKTDLHKNID